MDRFWKIEQRLHSKVLFIQVFLRFSSVFLKLLIIICEENI